MSANLQTVNETPSPNPGAVNQSINTDVQVDVPETRRYPVAPVEVKTEQAIDTQTEEPFVDPWKNAFCFRLSLSKWGISKKADINKVKTESDKELLRLRKQLIDPKPDGMKTAYSNICSCDSDLKKTIRAIALPSEFSDGFWLIAKSYTKRLREMLAKFKVERQMYVDQFITEYPDMQKAAKERLGNLYNEADYPSVDEMKFLFSISWKFLEYGVPSDLKNFDPELHEEEVRKYAQEVRNVGNDLVVLMREQAAKVVAHLVERLTTEPGKKKKTFKAASIDNVEEFLKFFEVKNAITQDGGLAAEVARLREIMRDGAGGTIKAEELRSNNALRDSIKNNLANVGKELDKLVKEKTTNTRKIAFFAETGD